VNSWIFDRNITGFLFYFWRNGMNTLAIQVNERVKTVSFTDRTISVTLMDDRILTVPLV